MVPINGAAWLQRLTALLLATLGVPALMSVSAFLQDTPIREGEPSPRTVISPDLIQINDPDATARERRAAAEQVEPVLVDDDEARAGVVQDVRDMFLRVAAARQPDAEGETPAEDVQLAALTARIESVGPDGLARLVRLSDESLASVREQVIEIAQQIAREEIREGETEAVVERHLRSELPVRSFPTGVAEEVVDPLIRATARPTVRVDQEATEEVRGEASAAVADVRRTFVGGTAIVTAGEVVDAIQLEALRSRNLEGAQPWPSMLRAFVLALAATAAVALYVRSYRLPLWRSSRRLLLLALLYVVFAGIVQAVGVLAPEPSAGWLYVLPAGAIAMLATILFDPPIGVLSIIPMATVSAYVLPGETGVAVFAALAGLASVPLVSRLSARGDLRTAAWRSTLIYVVLAVTVAAAFQDPILEAGAAGLLNGVITAIIVNGSLPFLESVFGVLTATSLLDLQDRNHPLLRELEQKALGSYNHSIMVSTMVERACRAIRADGLLGSVAALYHDIGKVRRPYFFVENQFGVANPHDELPPEASAEIIQRHVTDGIELARSSRLPPEVVEGIATHHGTTLVTYFYRQAANAAAEGATVDEERFRYKGRKPASKEMAVLMLADCCEGASRAAALHNRNLTRDDLENIVRGLFADRVEDGQLDHANLTFRELKTVEESFIETLEGVYHPRIAYPTLAAGRGGDAAARSASAPS